MRSSFSTTRPGNRPASGSRLLKMLAAVLLAVTPGLAAITVDIDGKTLNDVLSGLAVQQVEVPVSGDNTLRVELRDLRITGFEPGTTGQTQGSLKTSLELHVPDLGLTLPVEPRLSLHVLQGESGSFLELRFRQVRLELPLAGALDIARFLPPLRFPADNLFMLDGASGPVEIHSRLQRVQMLQGSIRFGLELEVRP